MPMSLSSNYRTITLKPDLGERNKVDSKSNLIVMQTPIYDPIAKAQTYPQPFESRYKEREKIRNNTQCLMTGQVISQRCSARSTSDTTSSYSAPFR